MCVPGAASEVLQSLLFLQLYRLPPHSPVPQRTARSPKLSRQCALACTKPTSSHVKCGDWGTHKIQTHSMRSQPRQGSPGPTANLVSASTSRRNPWGLHFSSKLHLAARKNCSCCSAGDSPAPSRAWVWSGDVQGSSHQHHCCIFSTTGNHGVTTRFHFTDELLNSPLGVRDRKKPQQTRKEKQDIFLFTAAC